MKNTIVYLARSGFRPLCGSASNRILSLSKGFVANGHKVVVLTDGSSTGKDEAAYAMSGATILSFANARCIGASRIPCLTGFLRALGAVYFRVRFFAKSLHWLWANRGNVEFVINYCFEYTFIFLGRLVTTVCGCKFYNELNEYPPSMIFDMGGIRRKICNVVDIHVVPKMFDGMIVMTKTLMRFYKPLVRKSAHMPYVAMTVDTDRFGPDIYDLAQRDIDKKDYMAYCGMIAEHKDGVPILVQAFAEVVKVFPDAKIKLIGPASGDDRVAVERNIASLGLKDNVELTGARPRDEMPALLARAKVLLLARPSSKRSDAGFPSKMGEYLLTGVPVLTTAVGEIPDVLTDGANAYLVKPDDAHAFAEKWIYILRHYDEAIKVGRAGRAVALREFSCEQNVKSVFEEEEKSPCGPA